MKHAGSGALDNLEPLLSRLRALGTLRETTRGVFCAKGRAVLHFHEDPAGIFADIRPPGAADFERIKVGDAAGQNAVLARLGAEEI
jgi:hypothetical protein